MCRACYVEYARVSGGAVGGEDPPAFKAAELKRKKLAQRNLPNLPAASRPCLPASGALPTLGAPLGALRNAADPDGGGHRRRRQSGGEAPREKG